MPGSSGAPFTDLLTSTAEISNLMSVLSVLAALLVMLVFLTKLIVQDMADGGGSGVTNLTVRSPQVLMSRVHVPFSLALRTESCGYSNQIHSVSLSVSSTCDYTLGFYWAVPIATFYKILQSPWPNFYRAFHESEELWEGGGQSSSLSRSSAHEKRDLVLQSPPASMELGPAPREVYPLVVVMVRSGSETAAQPSQVTALVNIIHLRDDICPIPSQVLSTYIRQGPSLTLLRQMFLSEGENSDTESAEDSETEDSPGVCGRTRARCVVCQVERVNRVALPCRHAASCQHCFDRLQARCPMCRALISSYFKLGPDRPVSPPASGPLSADTPGPGTGWRSWWARYNDWANNVRGAQQN